MTERNSWGERSYRHSQTGGDLPICCVVLIVVNSLVYLVEIVAPALGAWMKEAGCFGVVYLLYDNEWYRLISSAFLHADVEHLVNNMILLYFSGDIVERSLGKIRFLLLYLIAAVSGNLLSAAYELSTGSFYDSIGASGAVFGLTGALLFLVILKRRSAAHISLQRMLVSVALSFYAGFSDSSVNNAAHLGGLVTGFILAFVLSMIPTFGKRRQ